jgi:hypothetical protein
MAELRRVDIGFEGGQILGLRMLDEEYKKLRAALADERSDRWHQVLTQDSEVAIDLSEVVYIRLDTEEHRVGF